MTRARVAALLAAAALACRGAPPPPFDAGFRGPGRLVLLFEPADPDQPRTLVVHDASGAHAVPVSDARAARWLSARELLVSQEMPPEEQYGLPRTRLLRVDVASGKVEALTEPARYFDAEPDRAGARIAVGLEIDDQGESDLLVLDATARPPRPVAGSSVALDRPRWSPDGRELVVLRTLPDPEGEDSETGLSFGGQAVSFPRLFRVSADLRGASTLLRDGDPGQALNAGGSLPLWWDARGILARQRRGLVRCDPAGSGCQLVWAPGEKRRVSDGRPADGGTALVLVRDHAAKAELDLPRELYRIQLDSGSGELLYTAPPNVFLAGIDWIGEP
jgi:dipeptidyl aminopeptidase/acylaminoacyl peptidase